MDILNAYMLQGGRGKEGAISLAGGKERGIDHTEIGYLRHGAFGIADHIAEETAIVARKA